MQSVSWRRLRLMSVLCYRRWGQTIFHERICASDQGLSNTLALHCWIVNHECGYVISPASDSLCTCYRTCLRTFERLKDILQTVVQHQFAQNITRSGHRLDCEMGNPLRSTVELNHGRGFVVAGGNRCKNPSKVNSIFYAIHALNGTAHNSYSCCNGPICEFQRRWVCWKNRVQGRLGWGTL